MQLAHCASHHHSHILSVAVSFDAPGSSGASGKAPRILVTGSVGQIGTELVSALRARYGVNNVVASDIKAPPKEFPEGPFVWADVMNYDVMARVILENRIDSVVHLASLLSAIGVRQNNARDTVAGCAPVASDN